MPRQKHNVQQLANEAVVRIEILNNKIHCYPQSTGQTIIYTVKGANAPPLGIPREVRWVVSGLAAGQSIKILPKDRNDANVFPPPEDLEVSGGYNSITSDFPKETVGPKRFLVWAYDIVLCDSGGTELDRLDPDVIIKDYP
jgi:hypothetical protein